MNVSHIKFSVLGLAGVCLAVVVLHGTLMSENDSAVSYNDDPIPTTETVRQPAPEDRPDETVQAEASDESPEPGQPPRGPGERFEQGRPRGFGSRRPPGGEWYSRTDPNTVIDIVDPDAQTEAINLNNVEMRQIIRTLAEWTGKPVIPVNDEIMQTRVTIYAPRTVTRSEALSLLVMALRSRGILVEQLDNRVMLRPLESIRLGAVPTLGPDDPLARIEDKQQIVEKWFRLNNYDPSRLVDIIKPLVADYGYTVADESTSRVGVIETVENLMRIERLINQLDMPESKHQHESVVTLRYADPAEVVQVLRLILADGQTLQEAQQPRRGRPPQPEAGSGTVIVEGTDAVSIRLIPLVRQQQIVIRADEQDTKRIKGWISRLDLQDDEDEMRQTVVQVRFADVREVVQMVRNTLQQMPGTELRTNILIEGLTQTNQIVVYGTDSNRATVERLIAQIDLPKEDFFEERTFQLKHADPDQIKTNIDELYGDPVAQQPRFGWPRPSTSQRTEDMVRVIAYALRKQVTVIASPRNMERIARQIEEEWDKPLDIEQDQYRIVHLNNSDPVKLADLLKRLFTEETTGTGGNQNLMRMIFGGTTQDSRQKIVGSLYGMLTFEPVPDSKKLIVISQIPEAYNVVERMIQQLDARDEADVPRVITLKYADPEALCEQLNAILNEPGTQATIQRSARGLSAYDTTQPAQAVATSEEGGSVITPWWTRQRLDTTQMPISNLIGRARFVPVHRSKAILVLAPPEYLQDITDVIRELDRPAQQVMIKAVIAEINVSDRTSLGVKLASDPAAFGPSLGVNTLEALNRLAFAEHRGSFSFSTEANINTLVDLLVRHGNGRVLNQPTLWTKDNEEALFVKGERVAFITGDQTDATRQGITRTYDFEDVGITLRIRPRITPDRAVDLTINLNLSQLTPEIVGDQNVRSNMDSTTHMIVNDGQSVMMSGILQQNDDFVQHKIPLLGDLPVLGGLFRHEEVTKSNTELLIFITPYVFDENDRAAILTEDMDGMQMLERSRQRLQETVEALDQMVLQHNAVDPSR